MRKKIATILGSALLVLVATGAFALEVPPYSGHVNDLANMMSPAARRSLEAQLTDLNRTDSTQVAILTVPSLEGDSLEDFSIRVADAWKVGQKGSDNGVILLVSKADRKVRIEVGYGLEGVLTDVLSGQIIDRIIGPRFKAGDFDGGFIQGATAIGKAVRGEFAAAPVQKTRRSKRGVFSLIVIPMIIFIAMTEMFGKRRRAGRISDGRVVDGRQARHSGMGSAASTLFFLSMLGGGRGGGGGFGDGGGFGGFGGGGFGGGGASGDW